MQGVKESIHHNCLTDLLTIAFISFFFIESSGMADCSLIGLREALGESKFGKSGPNQESVVNKYHVTLFESLNTDEMIYYRL